MTKAELIAALAPFSDDTVIGISDADTGWLLRLLEIGRHETYVSLRGRYYDILDDGDE